MMKGAFAELAREKAADRDVVSLLECRDGECGVGSGAINVAAARCRQQPLKGDPGSGLLVLPGH